MRIRIAHHVVQEYASPARSTIQLLRLTPRNHEGQRVSRWRIHVDADCALRASEDAFGNVTHAFSASGPLSRVEIAVEGEVETFDTAGLTRGAPEPFPPELYLRSTRLTKSDGAMQAFAASVGLAGATTLSRLHALMEAVGERMAGADAATHPDVSAAEAFAAKRGASRDLAHIFIACARAMGVPARYVSGYFLDVEKAEAGGTGHGWAEAFVQDIGWIGFDAARLICPQEGHVGLARGLDYLGAAPSRAARSGGAGERLIVHYHLSRADSPRRT